jgi:hypothetical protein
MLSSAILDKDSSTAKNGQSLVYSQDYACYTRLTPSSAHWSQADMIAQRSNNNNLVT